MEVHGKSQTERNYISVMLHFDRYLQNQYCLQKREHTHLRLVRRGGLAKNEYVHIFVKNILNEGSRKIAN